MRIASRTYLKTFALGISIFIALQTAAFTQDKAGKIEQLMSLYDQYGQFNGAVLVADNSRVIYKKGFGLANMEWNIPNTPGTKFRLGSITKQFTATLILQLVEQGKIKLDGKLSDYLPDYRKDTGAKVTIHNLLSHTSGVPSYTSLPGFFTNVSRNPFAVDDFIKKYASGDLEFEPGTNFVYGFVMTKATLAPPTKLAVPVIQHNGGINGFNTTIVRMVADKRLIVLLDNAEHGQYLDKLALGLMSILYDQPYESPKRSIAETLMKTVLQKDVAAAVKQYRELKAGSNAGEYDFGEMELNRLGYRLLQTKKVAEAIEIFKLNVEVYPQSSNVYDSLGEGYKVHGDKELAITNYKKSLELNPKNTNAS